VAPVIRLVDFLCFALIHQNHHGFSGWKFCEIDDYPSLARTTVRSTAVAESLLSAQSP